MDALPLRHDHLRGHVLQQQPLSAAALGRLLSLGAIVLATFAMSWRRRPYPRPRRGRTPGRANAQRGERRHKC